MKFDSLFRERWKRMQETCQSSAAHTAEFSQLLDQMNEVSASLSAPLRIAVAGFMKAGKSTLMNALLRERLLFTGTQVTTYNVTWLKYGETPSLELVFHDGTREKAPLSALEDWTVIQKTGSNPKAKELRYVVIYYPNQLLKSIELVDTPGLFSSEGDDSQNTLNYLGLDGVEEVSRVHFRETDSANAIIYAFGRGFKEDDYNVIRGFRTTSINAIGLFTKTDQSYWDVGNPTVSPNEAVSPVIARMTEDLKDHFYRILPITALGVEGVLELPEAHHSALQVLAKLDEARELKLLRSAKSFTKAYDDIDVSVELRKELFERLGQFGLHITLKGIRQGVPADGLVSWVYQHSGVEEAFSLILHHFGNRSFLIKAGSAIARMEQRIRALKASSTENTVIRICNLLLEDLTVLKQDNAYLELELLRDYYAGRLDFKDDAMNAQFLNLVGENGSDAASRLGMPSHTPLEQLYEAAMAQIAVWSKLRNSVQVKQPIRHAAGIILHGLYERIAHIDALCGLR